MWCSVCRVLGRLAPVHRCACLGVLCRVHGALGLLAPVHRCARCVCRVVGAALWASWFLFSGVCARCVVLFVPCCGPRGSCSPACTLCVRCRVRGLLGFLAPAFWCARVVCVVWRVWCPRTLGSCPPVCSVCVMRCVAVCVVFSLRCCMCGVLGLPPPVQQCARPVCDVVCAWCPGSLGSCSPVCLCGVLCGVCGVLGHLAPVHRGASVVRCVVCTVSWASWLLFTGVHARCAVFCAWCPVPLGSCAPVCFCGLLCGVCGVLGLLAPVHRCARSVCGVLYLVSWASWLLFTGVLVWCVVWCARCPGPRGSCSPVCTLCVGCLGRGVLGLLAPVHRCAFAVCCAVCAVS